MFFELQNIDAFLFPGFLLLARVIAVTFCVTLAASMAARQGPIPMAAFQICLQIWLATSLLADGLAVAGQVRNLYQFSGKLFYMSDRKREEIETMTASFCTFSK